MTLAVTAALGGTAGTAEAATQPSRYVALGDSYASGAGVPDQVNSACSRSNHNYPSLVNSALAPAAHTDVTCGGATTADMTTTQKNSDGPQFNALTADTDLVTLTIGGNDVGFTDIIQRCLALGVFMPNGAPCKASYTVNGRDQLASKIDATAAAFGSTLDGIRQRSPHASILMTGYPVIAPDNGADCPLTVSIAKGDAPWLRDTEKHLNAVIAAQANSHGARYVDTYTPSIGHDICQPSGVRWTEPLIANGAAPFHPNAAGQRAMAAGVIADAR
ncbi:SGNH/GDSL hydrolase family protein [Streptomyces sp. NPDC056670]|uniref:SGNH/GDSL hydrolase family protein n=1 Tax=Streptomyces sp. NPDC056670 TaxID=3345904 RepID=UPI0036A2D6D9